MQFIVFDTGDPIRNKIQFPFFRISQSRKFHLPFLLPPFLTLGLQVGTGDHMWELRRAQAGCCIKEDEFISLWSLCP